MKNIFSVCCILILLSACQKEAFNIENLNNNKIAIYGHGGMGIGHAYPLNSFESIFNCLAVGADGTELDVQMTKDSILVAFHAPSLENTTNGSGHIIDKTWEEIKTKTYKDPVYSSYKIISLEELFSNIDDLPDFTFTFDCKLHNSTKELHSYYQSYINAINKIISKYDLLSNVHIESQDINFLTLLQASNPDYKLFIYPGSYEEGLYLARTNNLYGITISTNNISKAQIEEAHNNGLLVAIWNTHSKSKNKEAIDKNPDFIQTDKVKHLVKLLK